MDHCNFLLYCITFYEILFSQLIRHQQWYFFNLRQFYIKFLILYKPWIILFNPHSKNSLAHWLTPTPISQISRCYLDTQESSTEMEQAQSWPCPVSGVGVSWGPQRRHLKIPFKLPAAHAQTKNNIWHKPDLQWPPLCTGEHHGKSKSFIRGI